jgi:tol-pal system protein YbgF
MCSLRMYFARITGLEYTTTAMTFPYPTSTSFRLPSFARLTAALASALLLSACAVPPDPGSSAPESSASGRGSSAGGSLSADESADALRLAQESRLELQTQSARLKELEGQVRDLTEILSWTSEQIQNQNLRIDSLRQGTLLPGPAATSATSAAPAASTTGAPQRISSDEASQYRVALDQYFGRNYAAAAKAFTELQTQYPKGAYADNAEYWIGECRFAQGDFTGALASFRKVATYAGTEKADDAQLKIGYCHLRLNDRKKAEEEFRKLVSLYPSSEYVDRAQGEIDKLAGKTE